MGIESSKSTPKCSLNGLTCWSSTAAKQVPCNNNDSEYSPKVTRALRDMWPYPAKVAPFAPEFRLRPSNYFTENYNFVSVLAAGSFGEVSLHSSTTNPKNLYAVKCIDKKIMLDLGKDSIVQAKDEAVIMSNLRHTFICSHFMHWQTRNKLYIVMEYLPFGELFVLWKSVNNFSEQLSRFFLCNIALALDFMNKNSIIYRDLKMENLMIDKDGYLKVIDFGLSKCVFNVAHERAYTVCGTLQYTSPEMLDRSGYSYPTDWWSLGIMAYAMVSGEYPVKPGATPRIMKKLIDDMDYEKRVADSPTFSQALQEMLNRLLNKDPYDRLSLLSKLSRLAFFNQINFDQVHQRAYDARQMYLGLNSRQMNKIADSSPVKSWLLGYEASLDNWPSRYEGDQDEDIGEITYPAEADFEENTCTFPTTRPLHQPMSSLRSPAMQQFKTTLEDFTHVTSTASTTGNSMETDDEEEDNDDDEAFASQIGTLDNNNTVEVQRPVPKPRQSLLFKRNFNIVTMDQIQACERVWNSEINRQRMSVLLSSADGDEV